MSPITLYLSKPPDFSADVSVVVGFLAVKDHYLCLQKSAHEKEASLWGIPGGKKNPHESPPQALVREMVEETGITLSEAYLRHVTDCYVMKPSWRYTCHIFFQGLPARPLVRLSPEHVSYAWVTLADMKTMPLIGGSHDILELFQQKVCDT
ncbi:NUDIX hydrolase [bacterium NHP-B]|nr:NUDIX hydrolase [bacterium NHP-B]